MNGINGGSESSNKNDLMVTFIQKVRAELTEAKSASDAIEIGTRLAVPRLASWCSIDMFDEERQAFRSEATVGEELQWHPLWLASLNLSKSAIQWKTPDEQGIVSLPILRAGALTGYWSFVPVNDSKLSLLEVLCDHLAMALEHFSLTQALDESEELFRTTADCAPVLIWLTDIYGNITYLNQPFFEFVGVEVAPHEWARFVHHADLGWLTECLRSSARDQSRLDVEFRLRRGDGLYRWMLCRGSPRFDARHRFAGFTGSFMDISERKEALAALEDLNTQLELKVKERTKKLEEANANLEAFNYSVSHDLRAPLRNIKTCAMFLTKDLDHQIDEDSADNLQRILWSANQMNHLIEGLLTFARLGNAELNKRRIDLTSVARTVTSQMKMDGKFRNVKVLLQDDLWADADPQLIAAVLENLFDNAFKFSSKQANPVVEFGRISANGEYAYFVRDNGAGFDPQFKQNLFRAFHRLHGSQEFAGSGIGLANVDRIVRRHGGKVWAEGEVNHGATFYFTLAESVAEAPDMVRSPGSQHRLL